MAKKKSAGGPSHDPFDGDDDESGAVERDVQSVLEGTSVGEEEPDELEVGDPPEPERPSRDERRANRYREAQERADAALERATAAEARIAALEAQQNRQVQQPAPQPTEDPLKEQLGRVYKRQSELSQLYQAKRAGGKMTPEEEEGYMQQARELDEERITLVTQRATRGQPQLTREQIRQEAVLGQIQDRHSDVLRNPQYAAYAAGMYQMMTAEGHPDNVDTADLAAERTREKFGLASKNARRERSEPPTAQQRSRYAGTPQGGPGGAKPKSNTIQITPEIRQMADGAYGHIKNPRQRLQMWVNGPGKELLKQRNGG